MKPDLSDKCKNCGGDYGIHHYKTNQCPVGGREAPIGKPDEYKTTVFEPETNEVADLQAENKVLREALEKIYDLSVEEQGDWHGVSDTYSPEWTHAFKKIRYIAWESISEPVKEDATD